MNINENYIIWNIMMLCKRCYVVCMCHIYVYVLMCLSICVDRYWLLVSSFIIVCFFYFKIFIFIHLLVPMEARSGCWFYWSWSTGYSTGVPSFSRKTERNFNRWAMSPAPLPLIFETRSLTKSRNHKLDKT